MTLQPDLQDRKDEHHEQLATKTVAPPDHAGMATAALVLGIISIVLAFIPLIGVLSWVTAPLAIIFGAVSRRSLKRGSAIAGLTLGSIALVIAFLWAAVFSAATISTLESIDAPPASTKSIPPAASAPAAPQSSKAAGKGTMVCSMYDGEQSLPIDSFGRAGALAVVKGAVTGKEPASLQQAATNFDLKFGSEAQQRELNATFVRELNAYCGAS